MEEIMRDVCADFETELVEFNGETDHVHLLVNFPPKTAISKLVNSLKGRQLPKAPPRAPQPATALLAGEQTVVRLVLRRLGRRRTDNGPSSVHRAAEPTGLMRVDTESPWRRFGFFCSAGRS